MPWTRLKFAEDKLAENGNAVTPVQGDSTDVEDAGNSSIRSETDQVNSDAPEDRNPHRVQRGSSDGINIGPDARKGQKAVTGKGENGSAQRLLQRWSVSGLPAE